MNIYRGNLRDRQDAKNLLLADGWDEIGAEEILNTAEEQGYWLDVPRLMMVSADHKDR